MATQHSNRYKLELLKGTIHFNSDTFKCILMGTSFVYNPATHGLYADVSASQLATGGGYTAGGATMAGVSVTQDDTANKGVVTWNNVTWTASGSDIGPAIGAIIYDDTHANDVVVGYFDFGSSKTTLDGGVFTIAAPKVEAL
jgi:hypothetical protein